ncbi:hypothetical protein [Cellulomonas sp. NPDC089187]|uniref:hypothetical protein n=1 Tax=Cellulomonas sp. NPDC089187 TaxID=3154970 RepID=UPI0034227546
MASLSSCAYSHAEAQLICGSGEESNALAEKIAELNAGEVRSLADLVDFDWDRVWYFGGTEDPTDLKEAMQVDSVGRIPRWRASCAFHGLYFVNDGELVEVLNWSDKEYGLLFGDRGDSWGREVEVVGLGHAAALCEPGECSDADR